MKESGGFLSTYLEAHSATVSMNRLCDLCEKYIPAPAGQPHVSKHKQETSERHGRLNAMINYPFQDNSGSVDTALCPPENQLSSILRMTSPARKRWAQHVFDEMCVGRSKMRITDISDALKACTINVSPELAKALKQYAAKTEDANIGGESTIDSDQWYAIVKRCIRRERILQVVHLTKKESNAVDSSLREIADDSSAGDSIETVPSILEGIIDDNISIPNEDAEHLKQERANARQLQREQIRRDKKEFRRERSSQNQAALAAVGSRRVGSLIEKGVSPRAASSNRTAWRDPAFAKVPSSSHSGGGRGVTAAMVKAKALATRTKTALGRWADLESGTAAMEIADAFLDGSVGKELLNPSSFMYRGGGGKSFADGQSEASMDDDDIVSIVEKIESKNRLEADLHAKSQANYILHGNRHQKENLAHQDKSSIRVKTVRERETEKASMQEARSLYSQGWRSARGGWVADFGLPHTHALNRDEDYQYSHSLSEMRDNFYREKNDQKRKEPIPEVEVEGIDSYTMSVSNTIHAKAPQSERQPYMYSSLRSPHDRIDSLRRDFGLNTDSSTRRKGVPDEAVSQGSDDTPINMNRPSYHDAGSEDSRSVGNGTNGDDESVQAANKLFTNLHSSVSIGRAVSER